MNRRLSPIALALLTATALLLAACSNTGGSLSDTEFSVTEEPDPPPPPEDVVSAVGTVRYVDLEGGFYGLVADDSTRYRPANLGEAYREDGLRVRFRAVEQEDAMSAQMWGRPIEVLDILRLDG